MEKEIASKLGRQDWVNAALDIFIEKGIEAVKIDVIAKSLQITRGSFYWHFKNLEDLLAAIIQEWQAANTEDVMQKVETAGGEPSHRLLYLLEIAAQDDDRLEQAMRIWAIHDARATAAIERIDRQRLEYLESLFLQIGFSKTDAEVRARVVYSVRLGWFMMASPIKPLKRLTEIHLVHNILTQKIEPFSCSDRLPPSLDRPNRG
jgi:AcrR family transcriptional regulator